ncbi:MAG: Nif11-like leader peptide family RiPP precursor [Oscillospiraceae bacterium]|nr:Nif11-like leader peptide family RiPP precursor [Oscillospiraceae bacterium]
MAYFITPELEEKIKGAETLEDLVKVCAEAGVEVTKEQLETELAKAESEELDENALDDVAGGSAVLVSAAIAIIGTWHLYKYGRKWR